MLKWRLPVPRIFPNIMIITITKIMATRVLINNVELTIGFITAVSFIIDAVALGLNVIVIVILTKLLLNNSNGVGIY